MATVQFEHAIKDFAMWKAAFDRDPIDRQGLGVRRHRVGRPLDDPHYVIGELEFELGLRPRAVRRGAGGLKGNGAGAAGTFSLAE